MKTYGTLLSQRTLAILKKHENDAQTAQAARSFLSDMLDPSPERPDMLYRYEHSLRVENIGRRIAKAENLPEEPFVMTCLLHDVGYAQCETLADFDAHQFLSADIALPYLTQIRFCGELLEEMVLAIARHPIRDVLPPDMTPFQISVRDCDNIDSLGMIRTAMLVGNCVNDKGTASVIPMCSADIVKNCKKAIDKTRRQLTYPRGTQTAKVLFTQLAEKRIALLSDILAQIEE